MMFKAHVQLAGQLETVDGKRKIKAEFRGNLISLDSIKASRARPTRPTSA